MRNVKAQGNALGFGLAASAKPQRGAIYWEKHMPQSLAAVYVHLSYSTKIRQPWIQPEIEEELRKYHAGILGNLDSPMISSNGTQDQDVSGGIRIPLVSGEVRSRIR